jgi:hypothetical protein
MAECFVLGVIYLNLTYNLFLLIVIMQTVIKLNIVMLSVVAPIRLDLCSIVV